MAILKAIIKAPVGRKYITRFNYGNTLGWWVRILMSRIGNGQTHKLFSDNRYGSKGEALDAAILFRDKTFRRLTKSQRTIINSGGRSRLGTVLDGCGVYMVRRTGARGDQYEDYVANWWTDGKQHRQQFSVNKYGRRKAKRLAILKRAEMTAGRPRFKLKEEV